MKYFLLICLFGLLLMDALAQKTEKVKKRRVVKKLVPKTPTGETPAALGGVNPLLQGTSGSSSSAETSPVELEARVKTLAEEEGESANEITGSEESPGQDPCYEKRCGPGRECVPMEKGKAKCGCMKACPEEEDNRRRVCSNYNETWTSDCELYRSRCLCDENSEECLNPLNKHLHIEYYGECREMAPCSEEEMSDFPRRMRDWLFNVMRELADRRELSPHYLQMEREAERTTQESRRSVVAAVWKWCDLDGSPHDRQVSRHELFPIRAPLMALEHCIAPFLDNCDADNDHRITLQEWGSCLEIPKDEMLEKCDDVREGFQGTEEGDEEA